MQLSVIHETRYRYETPVLQAHHMAYLRPVNSSEQQLHEFSLAIEPEPSAQAWSMDRYGQQRCYFELTEPHEELLVVARSRLSTTALPPAWQGKFPSVVLPDGIPWEAVARAMQYEAGQAFDDAREYAQPSPLAPVQDSFRDYALATAPRRDWSAHQVAAALCHRIYRDFQYKPQATDVSTPPLRALALRAGVCQDFAQVMIAALRSLGLAARYVSGYLLTEPPPGQPRLVGADASHAWVSVYCPQAGWLEFDPTNNCLAGETHVRLAYGRDYGDVAPLRGVIRGGGSHELDVGVTVMPE
ncbi:transglutaminase family protein [Corticibacter populi]|uniref:Transglutaminase family protein n=1 Tax=Corticibacter populi TaxID=1550736 RepID=A0A3M6QK16_9BURK|nr:transglutaminase family protein [Corticibacter populi]RMX03418.1 transglutaminase family protein [Corticibacter populi]RZS29851.1 transglutaminase-like putative cysteine protease [Corticibacter populi]